MKPLFIIICTAVIVFLGIPAIKYISHKPMDFSCSRQDSEDTTVATETPRINDAKPKPMTLKEIEMIVNTIKFKEIK